VVPFGIDALVIVLAAKYGQVFWIFPPIVTAISLVGAALTYWIGRTAGDAGLPRLIAPHRLERIKARLNRSGAGALAVAAVLPPPFPLTPVLLTCGALHVDRSRFFVVFGAMRLVRFGAVAMLGRHYSDQLTQILDAPTLLQLLNATSFQNLGQALTLVGVAAATVMCAVLWSRTRPQPA
jgi:membrane protein YqaA with SNARE-associated domain